MRLVRSKRLYLTVDIETYRRHIESLQESITDYCREMRSRVKVIRGDEAGLTAEEENKLKETLNRIENEIYTQCENEYKIRTNINRIISPSLSLGQELQIWEEMRNEEWKKIEEDKNSSRLFFSLYDDMLRTDINGKDVFELLPIFRRLYMTSNWKPFFEECVRYKFYYMKIVELKNEKKKQQLLENNKELDEVRGYVDNMKGLDWKSPATKEDITAFMEALYSEDKFISLIKKAPKIGVANIIGYLVGNRYLKSQPKPISEQVFGDDKQVDSINHGKNGKSVSEEFRVLKDTLDSFKDKYIEGVKE